ncbi:hypothetical protein CK203_058550 [Vitis vinifera]|nr:hypothetical protein CK203_058550 [Vitis vinifera]
MVRSYRILPPPWNPNSQERFVNRFDSPPTAGVFTKVSSKPTNHSKFTGACCRTKCLDCHLLPACKSKGKTKGTQKMKPRDMVSNHRLITWRLVEGKPGLNFNGISATEVLDHLSREDFYDDQYYNDEDEDEVEACYDGHYDEEKIEDSGHACPDDGPMAEEKEIEAGGIQISGESDECDVDDDDNSFYEVGFVWEQVDGDEGWCLVREM